MFVIGNVLIFFARFILWEKPTLKGAVENANKKYKDINIKLK